MKRKVLIIIIVLFAVIGGYAQDHKDDGLFYYREGQFQRAADICLAEIEVTPRNLDSYVVLCWSYIGLGKYQEALDNALIAQDISRYDARVVEILGEAYYFLGENAKSLQYFEEYTVFAPGGDRIARVYFYMGEIFIRLGEYNHADIAFATSIYHNENPSARWWTRLGYAREMAKNFKDSLTAYEKALTLNPSYADASRGAARVRSQMNSQTDNG